MAELASFSNKESPLLGQFASAILTAIGFFCTIISFGFENIQKNFLEEHVNSLLAAIVLLAVGTLAGLLHVWIYYIENPPTDRKKKINTYLGCVSLHLLYMGLTLWLAVAVMSVYSWSHIIKIIILVTLAIAPLILQPIAIYIYHCKWRGDPVDPYPRDPERSPQKAQLANAILTAVGIFFTGLSFVSKHIHKNFLEEHVKFFLAAIVLLALGTLAGLFHVWNCYIGYRTAHAKEMNTYLGHFSLYLLYMGLILWLVVMFVYASSHWIMISVLVAFAIAPLILIPFGKYIYQR